MRHAASGLDGCRGCACYARRRRESTCENRTGTARSGLTRRPAAPCRGPASGVLPLPRACCCCSPSTQAKETLMKEASVPPMVEEKKLPKRGASKIARPRPAAGDEEENLSARRRRRKFCHCSLQKCLEHDGLVTPPDDIKVPESTQQMSNHWNVSGADGQRQHVQHRSDLLFLPGPQRANGGGGTRGRKRTEAICGRRRQKKRTLFTRTNVGLLEPERLGQARGSCA